MRARTLSLSFPVFSILSVLASAQDGGTVVEGSATLQRTSEQALHIHQHSPQATIQWNQFNIPVGHLVQFHQPNAQALAINKVTGVDPSLIQGTLLANGRVVLLNPNGIVFGPGAYVDVGGLVASTLSLEQFGGTFRLYQDPTQALGAVVNQGTIVARDGGFVILAAPLVENSGSISTSAGTIHLAAGREVTLDIMDNGLIRLDLGTASENGTVQVRPDALSDLMRTAVGIKNASPAAGGVVIENGVVKLVGVEGTAINSGNLSADRVTVWGGSTGLALVSGNISAGRVEVLGYQVALLDRARIDAPGGTVLIGGDYQGKGWVPNSWQTFIGPEVVIDSDAGEIGDGGTVIVWSDNMTLYYGSIFARGGTHGGNGGFVETSGKDFLEMMGNVDASAPMGNPGEWLLDPFNVNLTAATSNGGFSGGSPNIYTPTASGATANVATINTSLGLGTSVTITTGAAGLEPGNITVTNAVLKSAGPATTPTLTLNAAGGIVVNNTISSTSGVLHVVLIAGSGVTTNSTITTNGGNLTVTANAASSFSALNAGAGNITITLTAGTVTRLAGTMTATNLSITAPGGIGSLATPLQTSVNTITATTTNNAQFFTEASGLTALNLNAGTGSVTVTLTAGALTDTDAAVDVTAANLTLTAPTGIGALANPIQTNVDSLTATTTNANQFFTESNGLTGLSLSAGTGSVTLTLTLGSLIDGDAADDVTAANATLTAPGGIGSVFVAIGTNVNTLTATSTNTNQFFTESSGLTALNLNAGIGSITLTLAAGAITDADAAVDVTAANFTVTAPGGIGLAANRIGTSVGGLTATSTNTNQFFTESNGLTGLNLNAGTGSVTLVLSAGALTDLDALADVTAANLTLTAPGGIGTVLNPLDTSVNTLTATTTNTNQFFLEANGLTALNMNAGTGSITLTLAAGAVTDADAAVDVTAANLTLTSPGGIGALANPIAVNIGGLTTTTTNTSQFFTESNGLTALNMNAGTGSITLALSAGAVTDLDVAVDVTAANATLTAPGGFGALANRIGTSADSLTATSTNTNQFFVESNGLTAINLNAGTGTLDVLLTAGSVTDADAAVDLTASAATLLAPGGFGILANPIGTNVNTLTATTTNTNQFFAETNALTALNLNAGTGSITLSLAAGAITDVDAALDVTAANFTVTAPGGIGVAANPLGISVDGLTATTTNANQFFTETNGLTALNLNAGTGSVTLVLTAGSVTDGDAAVDVTAAGLTLTAPGGVGSIFSSLGINVNTLAATSTNSNQFFTETNGLTAVNLNAGTGNVTLALTAGAITDADGAVDITATGATITAPGGLGAAANPIATNVNNLTATSTNTNQFFTETNALTGLNLNAGTGAITLTLTAGAITDLDAADDIVATSATFTAPGGIGALANRIGTNVNSLTATSTNTSQFFSESNGLTALNLNAGTGSIDLTLAAGSVTDVDAAVDVTAANLTLTAPGGIGSLANPLGTNIGGLTATTANTDQFFTESNGITALNLSAGTGSVRLALTAGSITDLDAALDIAAANATLIAPAGIGSLANRIGISVDGLTTTTTNTSQFFTETNGWTSLSLSAGTGTVDLTLIAGAMSDLDAAVDITAATAVLVSPGGIGSLANPIGTSVNSLTTTSTNTDQFLQESNGITALNMNAGTGSVRLSLTAGSITDLDALADVTASAATLIAPAGIGSLANPLGTNVNDLSTTTTNTNQFLTETSGLTALNLNAGTGNITLTAGGAIADADAAVDLTGTTATLTATGGIGDANALNTALSTVTFTNLVGGAVRITDTNDLSASGTSLGEIQLGSPAGTLTINGALNSNGNAVLLSGAGLTLTQNISGSNVTLTANALGINQTAGTITAGTLNLQGAGPFTLNQAGNDVGQLVANVDGTLTFRDANALNVGAAGIVTNGNDLTITAGGALTFLGVIDVGAGTATLNADSIGPAGVPVTAATLSLNAANGIAVMSFATNLTANNTTSGTVTIDNTGDLTLGAMDNPNGDMTVQQVGNLTLNGAMNSGGDVTLTASMQILQNSDITATGAISLTAGTDLRLALVDAGGAVTLRANGGSILDNNDGVIPNTVNVQANGASSFFAANVIGVPDPIEIDLTGTLSIQVNGSVGGVSADLTGTVAPVNMITLIGSAPGRVFWNGVWINPPAGLGALVGNRAALNALTLILGSENNKHGWILNSVITDDVVRPNSGIVNQGTR